MKDLGKTTENQNGRMKNYTAHDEKGLKVLIGTGSEVFEKLDELTGIEYRTPNGGSMGLYFHTDGMLEIRKGLDRTTMRYDTKSRDALLYNIKRIREEGI